MLIELGVSVAIQLGLHIYHRLTDRHPKPPKDTAVLQTPRTEPGTPVPLVFGRVRVRQPILAWHGSLQTRDNDNDVIGYYRIYACDMLFVVGIPMGDGTTRAGLGTGPKLWNVWWGDIKLPAGANGLPFFNGSTTYYGQNVFRAAFGGSARGGWLRGAYYWHGGWTDQSFMAPPSRIGDQWAAAIGDGTLVPGLARQMCLSFVRLSDLSGLDPYTDQTLADASVSSDDAWPSSGFVMGEAPSVSSISAEVSTYGDIVGGVSDHIFSMRNEGTDFGGDADPAEVLYCLCVDNFGKLGLSKDWIDLPSFAAASATLKAENHGFSYAFDQRRPAREHIHQVLSQIDAVIRFNRRTRKFELKLIRGDYDPNDATTVMVIDKNNCTGFETPAASGWTDIVNTVRVTFTDRSRDYEENSVATPNQANAYGQGMVAEEVVGHPGITNETLAAEVAARELGWRSRPMMKLSALVDRSFYRVSVGDVVKVNWTKPDIAGVIFRVAAVDHGTITDGVIRLDLIQDAYYVWRGRPPRPPIDPLGVFGEHR